MEHLAQRGVTEHLHIHRSYRAHSCSRVPRVNYNNRECHLLERKRAGDACVVRVYDPLPLVLIGHLSRDYNRDYNCDYDRDVNRDYDRDYKWL